MAANACRPSSRGWDENRGDRAEFVCRNLREHRLHPNQNHGGRIHAFLALAFVSFERQLRCAEATPRKARSDPMRTSVVVGGAYTLSEGQTSAVSRQCQGGGEARRQSNRYLYP